MGRVATRETFAPAGSRVLGVLGLAVCAFFLVDLLAELHGPGNLVWAGVAVAAGVAVWAGLVRPRVTAYADRVRVANFLRDADIGWPAVSAIELSRSLVVRVGEQQVRSVAISAVGPDRRAIRQQLPRRFGTGSGGSTGIGSHPTGPVRAADPAGSAGSGTVVASRPATGARAGSRAGDPEASLAYAERVVHRLRRWARAGGGLTAAADGRGGPTPVPGPAVVRRTWAVPELVVLGCAVLLVAVGLLLR